jgi:hypothetical protein
MNIKHTPILVFSPSSPPFLYLHRGAPRVQFVPYPKLNQLRAWCSTIHSLFSLWTTIHSLQTQKRDIDFENQLVYIV